MKHCSLLAAVLVAVSGCGISAREREDLIRISVDRAGKLAEEAATLAMEKTVAKAVEEARKAGVSESDIAALEAKLRTELGEGIARARELAEAKAFEEADKRLPPAGKGGGWLGDLLLLLMPIVTNLGAAAIGKRLGLKGDTA
jgi:hypothetical protein